MKEYKTVRLQSCDEFIEKKSRFIGYVKPVETQEQAVDFINKIKSKHWDATHNVSAYVLRSEMIKRFSDDGEPSGTAGMPMLDVLEKSGVVDVCVVGTRYFGGIMLGAGGLVRVLTQPKSHLMRAKLSPWLRAIFIPFRLITVFTSDLICFWHSLARK